jgi:hypothetical protein
MGRKMGDAMFEEFLKRLRRKVFGHHKDVRNV